MSLAKITSLLLAATLLTVFASCGGGSGTQNASPPIDGGGGVTPTPQVPDPIGHLTSYLAAQVISLDNYASATTGSLKGSLSVTGYTILDSKTLRPLPSVAAIGHVPLRVVDPEDDVDIVCYASLNGTFIFREVPPCTYAILSIDFRVAEDINGDRAGNDRISCSIPVSITAGKQTSLQVTLSPLKAPLNGGYLGKPLLLSYFYKGPDGTRKRTLTLLSAGRTYLDANNDGLFGQNDIQFTDADSNALSDASEPAPASRAFPVALGEPYKIAGIINSYFSDRIMITVAGAGTRELIVSESTTIVDEYGVQVALSEYIIGKQAAALILPLPSGQPFTQVLMVFLNPQPALISS